MSVDAGRPALEGILLAAGAGRRLGVPKALLCVRGVWMLPRLAAALHAAGAARVHVVVRAEERAEIAARGLPVCATLHVNTAPQAGRASSVLVGLQAVSAASAVLVHPCDVPLLSAAAARALVEAWWLALDRDRLAARLVTPSGRGGHPLLLGKVRAADARRLAPGASLREILHADPARRLDVVLRGDPGPFLDVDTPEQLELVESLLSD
jgi:CTP:molybdopterin cytidylyltransferase MocA